MPKTFFASLTRIADFEKSAFSIQTQAKSKWRTGDYVAGEVVGLPGSLSTIELANGREVHVSSGDFVIGALGRRCATLQAVGDWRDVNDDLRLEALTSAGVLGRCTSKSSFIPPLLQLEYRGHVCVNGIIQNMSDCVQRHQHRDAIVPVILIIGTSMDSGKTLSAKVVIRLLKARGLRVAGAKFTGVGRYKDILAMSDAGADSIYDFVDAGLPSTCCEHHEYQGVVEHLLHCAANEQVDVIVGEAGASPLEPYNGAMAMKQLNRNIACTILCASDPYAVLGVMQAFDAKPDLVAGRATCTSAGIQLVEKLSSIKALDLMNPESLAELESILDRKL